LSGTVGNNLAARFFALDFRPRGSPIARRGRCATAPRGDINGSLDEQEDLRANRTEQNSAPDRQCHGHRFDVVEWQ
jgi:hypothetical protein